MSLSLNIHVLNVNINGNYMSEKKWRKVPSMAKINALKKKFSLISFFSGCGGSSTGYKMAGYDCKFANEFIPEAATTYRANHEHTIVDSSDIRKVKPKDVLKLIGLKRGELDLLDGSPPCSAFSNAGSRDKGWGKEKKYSDSKQRVDDLFDEYIRMVKYIQPRVFVAENVPGLVSGKAKGYYVHIIKSLTACGYKVSGSILDASYLDVPQARRRLIIVGVRNDLVKMGFNPVFPQKNSYQVYASDVLPYITGIREARSMSYIHAQRPFFTITASDATTTETAQFSSGGFIETKKGTQRKLTLKELRVASSFPKDFILTGTFEQQWERIGRAVPPMMMFHVAKAIRDKILIPYHEKFDEKL